MMRRLLVILIDIYQLFLSPDTGFTRSAAPTCRFEPSCSAYTKQAILKYGVLLGVLRGIKRICRCHPFHPGGDDPV